MDALHSIFSLIPGEWAQYEFMHHALIATVLFTPVLAIFGCLVINSQMAFFSDALGHAALAGVAVGSLLGVREPLFAMIGFSALLTVFIISLKNKSSASTDTILGLISSFAVALGIVLLSRQGGFNKYSRYLIGDILTVTNSELYWIMGTMLISLLCLVFFYNGFFLVSLDRTLAQSRGYNAFVIELAFAMLLAVVVTLGLPLIGLLVINSLLILPAATARNVASSTAWYVWIAAAAGVLAGVLGLISSFYLSTATGATIVLFAMFFFLISLCFRRA